MRSKILLALLIAMSAFGLSLLPASYYPYVKAGHIISVIAWMAGMLYLPRLFVYHSACEKGSETSETFKIMERRLLKAIINPAMVATWGFGLWLAWRIFSFQGGWLHFKIALVVLLSGAHGYLARAVNAFEGDKNVKSQRHWRIINEVPTVLMIAIVILVVVKPF